MMVENLLAGKKILVTGVTSKESIAYAFAEFAQQQGAQVIVSNLGRALSLTQRVVTRLDPVPPVIELDVTDDEHLARLPQQLRGAGFDQLDGVLHSIAFANPSRALGGAFLDTEWRDVAISLQTSAYSLKSLTMAVRELLVAGSSIVGLTFDASVSWPSYDWMGIAKAALESTNRYLARYLGGDQIRVNLVAAGPINSIAKTAIPGAEAFDEEWAKRAPLGWDENDATPVAKAIAALMSELFPATTGEIVHVDGGMASTGA